MQGHASTKSAAYQQRRIAETIVQERFCSQEQVDLGIRVVRAYSEIGRQLDLCDVLVRYRFMTREQAAIALDRCSANGSSANTHQSYLPFLTCQRYGVIPTQVNAGVLTVRASGPLSTKQLESIRAACSVPVSSVRVLPIARSQLLQQLANVMHDDASFASILEVLKREEISSVMLRKAIDTMLAEALNLRASDIHLDCKTDPDSWVSVRVDSVLHQRHQMSERLMSAVFTRIKTESGMDASDSLRPQDGRFSFEYRGKVVDFRVASQPIAGGETLTLRILDPDSLPTIERLFDGQPDMISLFYQLSQIQGKNGGLILFSGPTGSGKTTTLYTLTQRFPRDRINVITVEDPVEYHLPFARQIQLNQILHQKAVDVESSILRHDPDVIVFGEIRNSDSARAALKFTESGHLVLATIHAATATQSFERFMSFFDGEGKREAMFIMAHYLRLIVNQRLVPRLCKCAVHVRGSSTIRRRVGCKSCHGTGYFGRVVAHETIILPTNEAVRRDIARALMEGGHVEDAIALPGAIHKTRIQTLSELLANGNIDMNTVCNAVEV